MPWRLVVDFCSLAELKTYCQITDTSNDEILSWMVSATTDALVDYLGRDPRLKTVTEYYNGTGSRVLGLNQCPIVNVASIVIDIVPVDPSQFYWDDYCVYVGTYNPSNPQVTPPPAYAGFPTPYGCVAFVRGNKNVQVSYTGGYDPVPSPIKLAALMTAKAMWTGSQADQNATGESYAGVLSQQFWQTGPGSIPPQARAMLARYQTKMVVA